MRNLSISEWNSLFKTSPDLWECAILDNYKDCEKATGSSVISQFIDLNRDPKEGRLSGVPYGLKELFDLEGYPSTCSSAMPDLLTTDAKGDADIVSLLKNEGAVCVAKTQMNEFAFGLTGQNAHCGDCMHPRLQNRLIGGSSSGSAYLVSAGYFPFSIGTDTVGSMRVPAAWSGIYSLRLAPGQWMGGAFPLAKSFDSLGWFTKNAADLSVLSNILLSRVGSVFAGRGVVCLAESLLDGVVRIAYENDLSQRFSKCDFLEGFGRKMIDYEKAFQLLRSQEVYQLHQDRVVTMGTYYDPVVKDRILAGQQVSDSDLVWARYIQSELIEWFDNFFAEYDFLLLPAVSCPAIQPAMENEELRKTLITLNTPASLAGKPVLTIPFACGEIGETVGWQVIFNHVDADFIGSFIEEFL